MFDALADFHFLRPWWLLTLIPLTLLIYLWIRRTRQQSPWSGMISEPLLAVLIDDRSVKTATRLRSMMWLGALLAVIALSGPAWRKLPQPVEQKSDALVIVMDLSLSMFAQDVSPSRLEKTRQKIVDALRLRKEGSTGLVAYAGDGHAVVPITDDRHTIENLLSALSPGMMPVLGSRPAAGLELAHELFRNAGLFEGRILLLTDGIKSPDEISGFRNTAFPISIIGIGTQSGGPIPINRPGDPTRYLTDDLGSRILPRLNEPLLIQAAQQSYGRYSSMTIGDEDLRIALSTRLPTEDASIKVEREFDVWADMGFWLCLPLALLLLASFHRGVFAGLLLMLMLPETTWAQVDKSDRRNGQLLSEASILDQPLDEFWQGLWFRPDQRAYRALQDGDAETAAKLFDDLQWRGSARYRGGDYAGAIGDFARNTETAGMYNQGNAYAQLGRYPEAISRYDQVLDKDPDHVDAAFNKDLLEELLEQQSQQEQTEQNQQDNEQQQSQSDDSSQQEQKDQEEEDEDDEKQDQTQQEEPPEKPPEEQEPEEAEIAERDEKQEALEQWLRRVPDDPGGLLRRKFQHETKQRLRRGDYNNRQDDQVW